MRDRRLTLMDDIRALIASLERGDADPPVAALEDALTSGYAHALALEAERLRLAERLGDAARHARDGDRGGEELAELSERIASTDGDLTRLRAVLIVLRDRTRAARAAAASAA